jgi:NAD(P)-dependent dehydrogenase (short-subunit alcohol dehydrogenase family)
VSKGLEIVTRELGERAIGRVTDVSDENQVEAAMRAARETFGSLDIVVNCAGFGAIMPLIELPGEKWRSVHAVTLGGVFYGVKHGARQMLEQGRPGVVINISSVNARHPMEANSAYCAAKAGVDMITRCGALAQGPAGIRVVGIAPGRRNTVDAARAGGFRGSRAVHGGDPHEARRRGRRNCRHRSVSRIRTCTIHQRRNDRDRRRFVDARHSGAADWSPQGIVIVDQPTTTR